MSSVYMKVTPDRYQLPLGVADTVIELAKMCNVSEWTIRASLKKDRKGMLKHTRYVKVELPQEEDDEEL